MNITIATTPIRDLYFSPFRSSALGMHTIAKILKREGHNVISLNLPQFSRRGTPIPPLPETDHLAKFFISGERGKLSFFSGYKRFGPSFRESAEIIVKTNPEMVLLSSFAFAYADDAVLLVKELRKLMPKIIIGMGGAGVSAFPQYYGESSPVDFLVEGESEKIIASVVSDYTGKRHGSGTICEVFNGKDNPPASEDLDFVWSVTGETAEKMFISTSLSRGCPKRCKFCSNFITHGRNFRTVSLQKIEEGIPLIPKGKRIIFNFEDDNLTFKFDYFFKVLELFSKNFPEVYFMAENGLDYSFLSTEIIKKLSTYGLRQFNLSLGTLFSGAEEKRPLLLKTFEINIEQIYKEKIPSITYFISGLKGDSPLNIVKTLLYLAKFPTNAGISTFYPVPGIEGFTNKEIFKKHTSHLFRGASFYPWNNSLTTAQMVTAFRLSRFLNMLKEFPAASSPEDKELITRIMSTGKLHTLKRDHGKNIIIPVPYMDGEMAALFIEGIKDL